MGNCNCKKKSCNTCCPVTIRGKKGDTGPRGPRGLTGDAGPQGSLNGTEITNVIDQTFDLIGGIATVAGATFTPVAGTYIVWFETEWHPTGADAETTTGNYGIYLDGTLVNSPRPVGPQSGGGGLGAVSLEHKKMMIQAIVTADGSQVIDVEVECTSAAGTSIVITSGYSLIYIKIS